MRDRRVSHPVVYEVNTRVLLRELSASERRPVTLDSVPEPLLDRWASLGLSAIWLMGVWTTGPTGVRIATEHPGLREEYARALPDYSDADVIGSPYAVAAYEIAADLGGAAGLLALRKRLAEKGMRLILDFVCNHTARDHAWVRAHPEYYIQGRPGDEVEHPGSYFKTDTAAGVKTLAYGRDPNFPGWTDTAQLNLRHPGLRRALMDTLLGISEMCDGVRCDMTMLALEAVFLQTWGERSRPTDAEPATGELWKEAIDSVKTRHPGFLFIAEAYWGLEWQLQELGFDFTYDKTLYERLAAGDAPAVRAHLQAEMQFQNRSLRFIENHDEPRAARLFPNEPQNCAAAAVMATVPGMVLIHEGQMEGRKVRLPVQLGRRPHEEPSVFIKAFYERLLSCVSAPVFKNGQWKLLDADPAWEGNPTWRSFLAFWWHEEGEGTRMVVVNYGPTDGQCYARVPHPVPGSGPLEFRDLMGDAVYVREADALASKGMYFDMPAYGVHIFALNEQHPVV